ncbi:MAG: hypothetical protein H6741_33395 [Alphaproteobacteria bacterium]|nr:hypothetical protein [Alphaproteobacteria bacterium]MCB9797611.1 hypothetical protein [Alphaproteobacteria bacterium]
MFALILLSGCMSTKVWQDVDLDPAASRPALMVNASVHVAQDEDDSLAGAVMDIVQNKTLPEVGQALPDKLNTALGAYGMNLVVDGQRVKRSSNADFTEFTNDFTVLSGAYSHPEGTTMPLTWATLNRRRVGERMAASLDEPEVEDLYVYADVTIYEISRLFIMKETVVLLSLLVLDEQGEDVLRARAYGSAGMKPFVADRSPEKVLFALDDAINEMHLTEALITTADAPAEGSFVQVAGR